MVGYNTVLRSMSPNVAASVRYPPATSTSYCIPVSSPCSRGVAQDTCKEPVVLIGGGFISCEVAAAIATHCPNMQLVMVIPGEDVMASTGFGKEVCYFYEKQLARVSTRRLML